jgi:hypothetical protein
MIKTPRGKSVWLNLYVIQLLISILFYVLVGIGTLHWLITGTKLNEDVQGVGYLLLLITLIGIGIKLILSLYIIMIFKKQIPVKLIILFEFFCIFTRVIDLINISIQEARFFATIILHIN